MTRILVVDDDIDRRVSQHAQRQHGADIVVSARQARMMVGSKKPTDHWILASDDPGLANLTNWAATVGRPSAPPPQPAPQKKSNRPKKKPDTRPKPAPTDAEKPKPKKKRKKKRPLPQAPRIRRQGPRETPWAGSLHIPDLPESPNYDVIIDESGSKFSPDAKGEHRGRIVAVVFPREDPPEKDTTHCVDKNNPFNAARRVVEKLVRQPAGVLGLTMRDVQAAPGDLWANGVLEAIRWVLRLLPNRTCDVHVWVERRSSHHAGDDWRVIARLLQGELARHHPTRGRQVSLRSIKVVGKDCPIGGYPDGIAWLWANGGDKAEAALGDVLPHLHDGDLIQARKLRDALDRATGHPDPSLWTALLKVPAGPVPDRVSQGLADWCRKDPALWQHLLGAVEAHLDSKRIDLRAASQQIKWLDECCPEGSALSPPVQLAWKTAQLTDQNHRGELGDPGLIEELKQLGDRLFVENARLVCQADLHRAVALTNNFRFADASQALSRWTDVPPQVPGLQHHSRVLSSLGQHRAFLGDHAGALEYFQAALDGFEGLSVERVREGELEQTRTYAAIAAMDAGHPDARAWVERTVGPLDQALADPNLKKYAQHLVLRWLVLHPDEEALVQQALARTDTGDGHPWPLNHLYRALLSPDTAQAQFDLALASARQQGPTVELILCVIRRIAGQTVEDSALDELSGQLPAAKGHIDALRGWDGSDPLDVLRDVLPFNFR